MLMEADTADSFLLPQYGAVALLNPPSADPTARYHLSLENLNPSFHLFTQHLYSLLALPSLPKSDYLHPCPPASPLTPPSDLTPPLSSWQVDQVLRQRARENSEEARKTLTGIVRLVGKIKEMKLEKGVRDTVLGAVERLEQVSLLQVECHLIPGLRADMVQMDKTKDPKEQFILSRDAVGLANKAFFDPSMMGLLYFVSPQAGRKQVFASGSDRVTAGRAQVCGVHAAFRASGRPDHSRLDQGAGRLAQEA